MCLDWFELLRGGWDGSSTGRQKGCSGQSLARKKKQEEKKEGEQRLAYTYEYQLIRLQLYVYVNHSPL